MPAPEQNARRDGRARRAPTSHRAVLALAIALAAGAPWSIVDPASAQEAPERHAALTRLQERAARERDRPDQRAMKAPVPPGLDADALAPVGDDDATARLSLRDALPLVAGAVADAPDRDSGEPPNPDAVRRYVAGRQRLLAGDAAGAEREFAGAVRLDALTAAPWRALGESRIAQGNTPGALAALREALRRDPSDALALETLGRAAVRGREFATGASYLARWRIAQPRGGDPATPYLIDLDLGAALIRLGYLAAASEALRSAAGAPEPLGQQTNRWEELSALYRSRGAALRDAGDADLRLGRLEEALGAYDAAAKGPSLDGGAGLSLRRVHAAMRLGRPASAASFVLADIEVSDARPDRTRIDALRHIASHSGVGEDAARALDEIAAGADPAGRALRASPLALARAACLDRADAMTTLRARLREAPTDVDAFAALLERIGSDKPGEALRETIPVFAAASLGDERVIGAARRSCGARALVNAWGDLPRDAASSPSARLLRARLLMGFDPLAAERELASLVNDSPAFAPTAAALVDVCALLGQWADAEAALPALGPAPTDEALSSRARALATLSRDAEALEVIAPLADRESPDADVALFAARLAARTGDDARAERWFRGAIASAPTREEGYVGLIELFRADDQAQGRLSDAVRALREAAPAGRTLRLLLAKELAASGQHDRAERELLDLAERDPDDDEAIALLTSVWLATGAAGPAASWLEPRREANPDSRALTIHLARAWAASGKADDATKMLREWVSVRKGDAEASRALEEILRATPGGATEANALTRDRLSNGPRTTDGTLELAALDARAGRWADAATTLARLGAAPTLNPAQRQRLSAMASAAAAEPNEGEPAWATERDAGPLAALDAIAQCGAPLTAETHLRRLTMLALSGADRDRVLAACALAASQQPSVAVDAMLTVLDALREAQRPADASAVARWAALDKRPVRSVLAAAWLALAALAHDAAQAEEAIRVVATDRQHVETLASLARMRRGLDVGETTVAELAYAVGAMFASEDLNDEADRLWRVALEFDPRHPMANNNIGFRLAEKGERLAEAHAMLAVAHAEAPEETAITDSIGWVRYRLGIVRDRTNEAGAVVMEGALTLLRRAARMEMPGAAEPEILDHLGDAAWAAGEPEEARLAWTKASEIAAKYVEALMPRARQNPDLAKDLDRLRAMGESARAKATAATTGGEPPVVPIVGGGDKIANDPPRPPPPPPDGMPAA